MGELAIRPAVDGDAAAVARLNGELGYSGEEGVIARRLAGLLASHKDAVFVAENSGAVVGWIHVTTLVSLENEPAAEIKGLVVTESERSQGTGARLVDAAEGWAARRGLPSIRVRSNVVRERARRFYERIGYSVTKTQNVFDKKLPEV